MRVGADHCVMFCEFSEITHFRFCAADRKLKFNSTLDAIMDASCPLEENLSYPLIIQYPPYRAHAIVCQGILGIKYPHWDRVSPQAGSRYPSPCGYRYPWDNVSLYRSRYPLPWGSRYHSVGQSIPFGTRFPTMWVKVFTYRDP